MSKCHSSMGFSYYTTGSQLLGYGLPLTLNELPLSSYLISIHVNAGLQSLFQLQNSGERNW